MDNGPEFIFVALADWAETLRMQLEFIKQGKPTQHSLGSLYLVAVMDWYSRKILAWRLSNTMDTNLCLEALQDALGSYQLRIISIRIKGHNLRPQSSPMS